MLDLKTTKEVLQEYEKQKMFVESEHFPVIAKLIANMEEKSKAVIWAHVEMGQYDQELENEKAVLRAFTRFKQYFSNLDTTIAAMRKQVTMQEREANGVKNKKLAKAEGEQ